MLLYYLSHRRRLTGISFIARDTPQSVSRERGSLVRQGARRASRDRGGLADLPPGDSNRHHARRFRLLGMRRKNQPLKLVGITLARPQPAWSIRAQSTGMSSARCYEADLCAQPSQRRPVASTAGLRVTSPAAGAVAMDLIDHVIPGRNAANPHGQGHYSFRQVGML